MGIVTDYLVRQIERQVDSGRLVVWFDPGEQYVEVAATLDLPATRVARYEGSFFALRREVDGLLEGERAPRLVVTCRSTRARRTRRSQSWRRPEQ